MSNELNNKKTVLEVTPSIHERVSKYSKNKGVSQKQVTTAILEHTLPDFESGLLNIVKSVHVSETSVAG